jgi:hypothetical protein
MKLIWISLLGLGCATADSEDGLLTPPVAEEVGLAVLGAGTQSVSGVNMSQVNSSSLNGPRDLALNPDVEGELWVVNGPDDSMTIISNAGTSEQNSDHVIDPYAMHFMDKPSSIAFGAALFEGSTALNFGTCHESENTYNDQGDPNWFMGPSLWSSDRDIFGTSNPDAVEYLTNLYDWYTDLGSHLDMLHESPLCMGIAHDRDNVYWVFDGYNESIYRYDFQEDHGVGWDDHDDGIMARYAEGEVGYTPDVPSHLILDQASRLLYIADTANNRIAILDTESGSQGSNLYAMEPDTTHYKMDDAELWTFIDGEDFGLQAPSGIDLVDNVLFVTDNTTSEIVAFDITAEDDEDLEIDRLDTELEAGSLMGIFAASIDDLWLVDAVADRVYRIQPN